MRQWYTRYNKCSSFVQLSILSQHCDLPIVFQSDSEVLVSFSCKLQVDQLCLGSRICLICLHWHFVKDAHAIVSWECGLCGFYSCLIIAQMYPPPHYSLSYALFFYWWYLSWQSSWNDKQIKPQKPFCLQTASSLTVWPCPANFNCHADWIWEPKHRWNQ